MQRDNSVKSLCARQGLIAHFVTWRASVADLALVAVLLHSDLDTELTDITVPQVQLSHQLASAEPCFHTHTRCDT